MHLPNHIAIIPDGNRRWAVSNNLHKKGGHNRLSGLLPIQSVYADFYSVDTLWPDFKRDDFVNALKWYNHQDVTLGG